uniref:Complex 1 LYR protein domain-containing protein n=1 Tax=Trieres chinensis TaxID=1514140 RepID=A0A7S2ED80_TRICV
MASPQAGGRELLHLYRRILRSCATYPSKNRRGIYEAIREEFRECAPMDPESTECKIKVQSAYKGLQQLRMYDEVNMSGGDTQSPNWSVTLEQNPFPKPPHLS